jgi:hypothetical protein
MPDGINRCTMLYGHGHNEWLKEEERRNRIMAEQFKVGVSLGQRVAGWLYDYDSGVCMGVASDELKKKYPLEKQPFNMNISGCPHKLVIHAGSTKAEVVTNPVVIYQWVYLRTKGDIEVFAPTETEAERLVRETGLVKNYQSKKLQKTDNCLADSGTCDGVQR